MTISSHRYAIILCGGSGTRLWPLSRNQQPKQFLSINGSQSLFQETLERLRGSLDDDHIWIVAHESHELLVKEHAKNIGLSVEGRVLSEPLSCNTLPAIIWGVNEILKKDPEAVIGVFSSDHAIKNTEAFRSAWFFAEEVTKHRQLVLLGIRPNEPSSAYGYIELGDRLEIKTDILFSYHVKGFIEKPTLEKAKVYLNAGYLWNSGMFVFKGQSFTNLVKSHQPEIYQLMIANKNEDIKALYKNLPQISIDYGIAEKAKDVAVVPVNLDWTDLGNWDSIYNYQEKDPDYNVLHGSVINIDSHNSLLWAEHGTIASYGLSNIVAIQTNDATLICDRNKAEDLKPLIAKIKTNLPQLVETHQTVQRPWGQYTTLEETPFYKIKRIVVNAGAKLSLQSHKYRSEHWVVVSGIATIIKDDKEFKLEHNRSMYIEVNEKHRLMNLENKPLEIIEVQCGSYIGEDDIDRYDDIYGRVESR